MNCGIDLPVWIHQVHDIAMADIFQYLHYEQ